MREAVRPEVAEMALAATFLASEGLALTADANILFVDAVSQRLFMAYAVLEQRARGDYSRDAYPDTFPAYVDQRRGASTGMRCWDLFGAYVAARSPPLARSAAGARCSSICRQHTPGARPLSRKKMHVRGRTRS